MRSVNSNFQRQVKAVMGPIAAFCIFLTVLAGKHSYLTSSTQTWRPNSVVTMKSVLFCRGKWGNQVFLLRWVWLPLLLGGLWLIVEWSGLETVLSHWMCGIDEVVPIDCRSSYLASTRLGKTRLRLAVQANDLQCAKARQANMLRGFFCICFDH